MKNIVTFLTGCFIVSLVLTSCSSNTSIVKRHYTKGYYVNWGKAKPNVTVAKAEDKPSQARAKTQLQPLPVKENIVTNDLNSTPEPVGNIVYIKTTTPFKPAAHKAITQNPAKQPVNNNIAKSAVQYFESSPLLSPAIEGNHGDDAAGAALSLLWIVIVIVLIIWLVGLLAGGWGLGGLINILLIIAIILLILWLLRIA